MGGEGEGRDGYMLLLYVGRLIACLHAYVCKCLAFSSEEKYK